MCVSSNAMASVANYQRNAFVIDSEINKVACSESEARK